jgi:hypothetical protein
MKIRDNHGSRGQNFTGDIFHKLQELASRTIIGSVDFLANLLNIPTDGTPVSAQKSASQNELLFVRL